MSRVVVLEGVWGTPFEDLAQHHDVIRADTTTDALVDAEAVVVRNRTQIDAEVLDAAPRLRIVARAGVGLDNIDLAACDARGVVVVSPRGANAVSVAEHTLGLALSLLRGLPAHDYAVRAGRWDRTPGRELSGGTWALLGCGATGRALARLLRGFELRILGHDPYAEPGTLVAAGIEPAGLDRCLAEADVLSVHLPATPETTGLLGTDAFARMRDGAVIVNVGRGEVIDEVALTEALRSGRIAGAALDVRASEPPDPGPLDDLHGVQFSPHVAGITAESQHRIAQALADDIDSVLSGRAAANAAGRLTTVTTVETRT